MSNKPDSTKEQRSHLRADAAIREAHLAAMKKNQSSITPEFKLCENSIFSRRPTRLTLALLSKAKEISALPDVEKSIFQNRAMPPK